MGKNLDKNIFSIDGWTTNPCGEVVLKEPEARQLTGKFPKKKGRPKMTETFFYDPHETSGDILVGIDTATTKIGDVVIAGAGRSGYITKLIGSNTVKINWQITYKE